MHIAAQKRFGGPASFLTLLLLTLAFSVKALLPAGFMPSVTKDGMLQIVICSGTGEKTISIPAGETPDSGHNQKEDGVQKSCAYHILASSGLLIATPETFLPMADFASAERDLPAFRAPDFTRALSFEARGPPRA